MAASLDFPRGTVTFLFTDIEGSTLLWERDREAMRRAVDRHIALLGDAIAANGGVHFKTIGDAVQAAFHTAPDALAAAIGAQGSLRAEPWPDDIGPLRVRMALHAGSAQPIDGDYLAPALNRLARTLGIGHGGQILVTEAVRGLLSGDLPHDVSLRSLGEHALRGLQEPEEVFQVVALGLVDTFPPLRSLPHHPTNLIALPTPLVGRGEELATITCMLGEGEARLVTLTGPGGAGKTRLALEAAAELLDAFSGGVFVVDLSALRDHRLVVSTIAGTLGVREASGQALFDVLVAFLAQTSILLVLDNVEQVIEAAADIAALLAVCPTLALLVTSREPLRIRAEHELPVGPLALAEEVVGLPLEDVGQTPAISLFVSRANASKPGFTLTEENVAVVAEICRRLDGLPLAIELAAARIRLLPPAALLARLDKRLPLLTGGARDLPARQRTLRDTIAWSHDLLNEDERATFRRLGVFVGGWDLEMADIVANADGNLDAFAGLESLIDQNLVRLDEGDTEPRYTMLETIREFAAEQLVASGDESRLRERHAEYLLNLSEEDTGPPLSANQPDEAWARRMERDQDNLRAALAWWLERGDGSSSLRLAVAASRYWAWCEQWAEGRSWLERALALQVDGDPDLRVRAITFAGSFASSQGDSREAIAFLESGLAIPGTPELRPWHMVSAQRLAQTYSQMRDVARAMPHYEYALELAIALNDRHSANDIRWSMAYTANSQGDTERARELAKTILDGERDGGNLFLVAAALELVAWIELSNGDVDGAAKSIAEGWNQLEQVTHRAREVIRENLLVDEAVLAYRRDDFARSAAMVSAWLPRARAIRSLQQQLLALLLFASIVSHRDPAAAARWFGALYASLEESQHGMHLEPAIRPWHETDIERTRETIGADAFDRAWTVGARVPLEQMLSEAETAMQKHFGASEEVPAPIVDGAPSGGV